MARVEGGAVIIETDWPGLKLQIDTRNINFKYEEDTTAYEIFAIDGQYFYRTIIYKSGQAPQDQATYDTYRSEFETSYKGRITDFNSTQPYYLTNIDGYTIVLKDGAAPTANDGYGIAVIGSDGSNYRLLKTDTSGRPVLVGAGTAGTPLGGVITIQGAAGGTAIPISGSITANNASVSDNDLAIPLFSTLIGGSDGTNLRPVRIFDLDSGGGQQWILGVGLRKASGGGSVELGTSSDPIRIDPTGTTIQPVSGTVTANAGSGTFAVSGTVTANAGTGNFTVVQSTASNLRAQLASESSTGAAITSTAVMIGGSDGTNLRSIFVDSSGRQIIIGAAANGAAVAGNPVLIAGSDGTNARSIRTASDGTVRIDPTGTTIQPVSGTVTANAGTGTFTVSGTVTANIGTSGSLALDATLAKLTIAQSTSLGSNTQALVGGSVTTAAPTYTTGNINPLSLTTAGALRIDGSAVTQPISGTVTANAGTGTFTVSGTVAATQSGTWTVQPGNTANSTPWLTTISQGGNSATVSAGGALKVDGSAVTQPVSGTVTANIGTTNGLALDTSVNGILLAQNSTTSGQTGPLIQGAVTTAAPSYTTAKTSPLSLTTAGALRIDGSAVTQPVSGTVTANAGSGTFTVSGTVTANIGTSGSLALDATLSAQSLVDNAGFTDGTSRVVPSGHIFDEVAGTALTENDVAASRVDAKRAQVIVIEDTTTRGQRLTITASNAMKVDGSAVTQPVSGTVTANIGTSGSLALDATLAKLTITQGTALGSNTQAMVGGSVTTAAPSYTTGQISPLSLTTAGALRIDGSSVTQPVSGTVTANAGSGTFTVSGTVTANIGTSGSLALDATITAQSMVDNAGFTDGTTRIIPSGYILDEVAGTALTENDGAAARIDSKRSQIIVIEDETTRGRRLTITSSNAMKVDGSAVTQPVSGTVTANIGTSGSLALEATQVKMTIAQSTALGANTQTMVGGSVTTAAPTYTTGNINPLSLTTTGALRIDGSGVTQPVSGTVTANIGTSGSLALDATVAAQSLVDNAGFTDGTSRVTPSGHIFDETAGTALTENDVGASRMDSKRAQVIVIEDTTTRGQRLTITASNAMKVDGSAVTQPVSGTVTANIGTSGSLALDATLAAMSIVDNAAFTDGTTRIQPAGFIFDEVAGTALTENDGAAARVDSKRAQVLVIEDATTRGTRTTVKAASTAAVATDPALVVAISPNNSVAVTMAASGYGGQVEGRAADGVSPVGNPVLIGGSDGTNAQTILTDTSGRIIVAPSGSSSSVAGFVFGDILLSVVGNVPVRRNTLTEQSSNAQRSVVSSSANDTSAGTGARQVKITYYDSTGAGPSTETVTLNGTTPVNTVSTTICYVEKVEVTSIGSTGSNVGAITLKAATAGGGATILTMSATDNITFLSVHYVPTGKTCFITGLKVGSNSSGIAQGGLYTLRAQTINSATAPDRQISDFFPLFGQSSGVARQYDTPIQVAGPARIQLWVNPFSNNTVTFMGGFDFYDQ